MYHPDLSEPSDFTQNWGNDMNHPELETSDAISIPFVKMIWINGLAIE